MTRRAGNSLLDEWHFAAAQLESAIGLTDPDETSISCEYGGGSRSISSWKLPDVR
jgi:hypothetical protein